MCAGDLSQKYDDQLRYIFIEIANGRGNHGSFLRAFAETRNSADSSHFALLRGIAWEIVDKHDLRKYLP